MATAIRQRAVKTLSGRATARGTGGLPALAPEGDLGSDMFCQALGASRQALAALIPDDVFIKDRSIATDGTTDLEIGQWIKLLTVVLI